MYEFDEDVVKHELSRYNTCGVSKTFWYRHREYIAILGEKPEDDGYYSCTVFESNNGKPIGPGCVFVLKGIPKDWTNIALNETIAQFFATRPEAFR